jgi:hypothetical protein
VNPYCNDCPDHEGCYQGWDCWHVKRENAGKTSPKVGIHLPGGEKMKKPNFERIWDRTCQELEERPVVMLGLVSSVIYGASQLMDSNTRRKNAATARRSQKTYDKEINRRIRKEGKR